MSDISLRGVRKSYNHVQVVHGVDLEIRNGEFIVVLGPSGCGKSTLLRMVAGLEAISEGEIAIAGTVVNKLEPRERGCAMVFQNYALYPHMSVADNIGYALKVAGVSKAERLVRVRDVARMLDLEDYLQRKPAALSGGQRQRVAMGRAMIREPKVFLYDEPLSNLDAKLRVAMRMEIRKLHQRLGATSIFVTHDQVEALTLADRIVVMNKGKVEQVATPREIYHRPASVFVAGFIGTPGMCLMNGEVEASIGRVRLEDGQSLPLDKVRFGDLAEGLRVTIGLRAEDLQVSQPNDHSLLTRFEFMEEMGAAQTLHCRVAGTEIVALSTHETAHQIGEELNLSVDPSRVHIFDRVSGLRLGQEATAKAVLPPLLRAAE